MNKTEFLAKAKSKYKNQLEIENKFVAEMNFVYSTDLILRVWFDVNFKPNNKFGETGYMHKWCKIELL